MDNILRTLSLLWDTSGFHMLFADWRQLVMIALACLLLYLGLVKKFEPLLLVGIAFGMLLTNLPGSNMYHPELWDAYIAGEITLTGIIHDGGLLDMLYREAKVENVEYSETIDVTAVCGPRTLGQVEPFIEE